MQRQLFVVPVATVPAALAVAVAVAVAHVAYCLLHSTVNGHSYVQPLLLLLVAPPALPVCELLLLLLARCFN